MLAVSHRRGALSTEVNPFCLGLGMRFALSIVLTATLAACGSSLDTRMNGAWQGNWTQWLDDSAGTSSLRQLTLSVTGETVTVSGICPDGSGSITAEGNGDTASWSGNSSCPPATVESCASGVLSFTLASVGLSVDDMNDGDLDRLGFDAFGSYSGCGVAVAAMYEFLAWR